jgi:hypothetical protein
MNPWFLPDLNVELGIRGQSGQNTGAGADPGRPVGGPALSE